MINEKEYNKIHLWLSKTYGKPKRCENKRCPRLHDSIHWALKKNKEYEYNKKNFYRLCSWCHKKYDTRFSNTGKVERTFGMIRLPKSLLRELRYISAVTAKAPSQLLEVCLHRKYPKIIRELNNI